MTCGKESLFPLHSKMKEEQRRLVRSRTETGRGYFEPSRRRRTTASRTWRTNMGTL